MLPEGPRFDRPVARDGYAWWYIDALSDDGRHALTIIAFIGSVFSPYYAWARRRGRGDPENHVALNVALYGPGRGGWAMTERGRNSLRRSEDKLEIGPSALNWSGRELAIEVDEWRVPIPSRLRGAVKLAPDAINAQDFAIDSGGRHRWRPIAPSARIEVAFTSPGLRWSGRAYFDMNEGDGPLERDFLRWTWSRAHRGEETLLLYDTLERSGARRSLALSFAAAARAIAPPPSCPLPSTFWRIGRETRSDEGSSARIVRTLEDTPFYARSVVASRIGGANVEAIHESLDLTRFASPVVQAMLPFRMPRRGRLSARP